MYVNKTTKAGPQVYPLLSTHVRISTFYGLIVAKLAKLSQISQTCIKIDKVKKKAKFSYLSTASIYESSLILVNVISCILICLPRR